MFLLLFQLTHVTLRPKVTSRIFFTKMTENEFEIIIVTHKRLLKTKERKKSSTRSNFKVYMYMNVHINGVTYDYNFFHHPRLVDTTAFYFVEGENINWSLGIITSSKYLHLHK